MNKSEMKKVICETIAGDVRVGIKLWVVFGELH